MFEMEIMSEDYRESYPLHLKLYWNILYIYLEYRNLHWYKTRLVPSQIVPLILC